MWTINKFWRHYISGCGILYLFPSFSKLMKVSLFWALQRANQLSYVSQRYPTKTNKRVQKLNFTIFVRRRRILITKQITKRSRSKKKYQPKVCILIFYIPSQSLSFSMLPWSNKINDRSKIYEKLRQTCCCLNLFLSRRCV